LVVLPLDLRRAVTRSGRLVRSLASLRELPYGQQFLDRLVPGLYLLFQPLGETPRDLGIASASAVLVRRKRPQGENQHHDQDRWTFRTRSRVAHRNVSRTSSSTIKIGDLFQLHHDRVELHLHTRVGPQFVPRSVEPEHEAMNHFAIRHGDQTLIDFSKALL